ncbi:AbrB/MazE/SpoVT family DNA-binding domain-containing protein [Methanobrevibacter curvatus]|uniref:SpoVT-AbrB domain-containing protein n=1 Tax=Methanobrevibacter curvatus TaxID=49547 RepID=A0A166CB69_9EURY|nr:hypothetical protein [Methanobrevibacter curvatus]KZX14325.1 hypothetical protein MBCUR_05490 [Methanobrevibacter curvatus]
MTLIDTEENIIIEAISKVSSNNNKSKSNRTVIPKEIANSINLKNGDSLNWRILTKNDVKFLLVKKIE